MTAPFPANDERPSTASAQARRRARDRVRAAVEGGVLRGVPTLGEVDVDDASARLYLGALRAAERSAFRDGHRLDWRSVVPRDMSLRAVRQLATAFTGWT